MENKTITLHIRDVNGKRYTQSWRNRDDFLAEDWNSFDEDAEEILLITWGEYIIYNQLVNESICIDELIGFFA